jgi:hypothetical protein
MNLNIGNDLNDLLLDDDLCGSEEDENLDEEDKSPVLI